MISVGDRNVCSYRNCDYRKSTIFHCHLIFVGRRKNENKKHENIQHNTKQWYRNAFSGLKLENEKNGEQLKHRNIMNEILWIYGIVFSMNCK